MGLRAVLGNKSHHSLTIVFKFDIVTSVKTCLIDSYHYLPASIGEISSTQLDYTDSILTLTYTGADLCPSTKKNYKTVIQFLCNEEDLEVHPSS